LSDTPTQSCSAFLAHRRIAHGPLLDVALAVKALLHPNPSETVLVFDDATGRVIDLDLRGTTADIAARLAPTESPPPATRGRGRPALGVVAREVTLLPRHWDWLATQRGGASVTLRRLVEQARQADKGHSQRAAARDAAYRFMAAMAGNLPGFEEASRALFADDRMQFDQHSAQWPHDIRHYTQHLAWAASPSVEPGP
jgi:uncharacterized protein